MYSLYRAWFGGEEAYPRLENLSPPDTLVRVGNEGEHQFVAHRGVLAAHSGYLKALLATTSTTTTSCPGREDITPAVISVSVSSVGGEAFAPLLNYMYTGRLEVTLENIYSVLLATHLLHMPGALEQCRAALLRLRAPSPVPVPTTASSQRTGTILRPVPNRLLGPPLCWTAQPPNLYPSPHVGLSHLSNFQLSSGMSILPSAAILQETTTSALPYSFRDNAPPPPSPIPAALGRSENRATSPRVPSTSTVRFITEEREKCTLDKFEEEEEEEEKDEQEKKNDRREKDGIFPNGSDPADSNERIFSTTSNRHDDTTNLEVPRNEDVAGTSSNGNGVIYDIACCDGPVRFHRVLNENYVSKSNATIGISSRREDANNPSDEETEIRRVIDNDENGKPDCNTDSRSGGGTNGCYTCGYCLHTFKSHYCYRKHARRHLLPSSESDSVPRLSPNRSDGKRREVKLLDLNVQYYPCKICGSKFPSYYFVHKHKKLCHANVEDSVTSVVDGESSSVVVQGTSSSSDP